MSAHSCERNRLSSKTNLVDHHSHVVAESDTQVIMDIVGEDSEEWNSQNIVALQEQEAHLLAVQFMQLCHLVVDICAVMSRQLEILKNKIAHMSNNLSCS